MPEGLEAEIYRRAVERTVGRTIERVDVDPRQPMAVELGTALPGRRVVAARRHGKQVMVDLDDGHALGLHFGMTGRLVVDDRAAIDQLEYASRRNDPAWDRFSLVFTDGGDLRVNDPRRWARFTLDPDISKLGPDMFELSVHVVEERLAGRRAAIKTLLLDQGVVAGLGNMCVDEVLWQAGISPRRGSDTLDRGAIERLVDAARRHLPEMLERGGSHTGVIDPEVRASLPPCPRDGAPLVREVVGGRTTIWCRVHQR